jgi:hypothetical protein
MSTSTLRAAVVVAAVVVGALVLSKGFASGTGQPFAAGARTSPSPSSTPSAHPTPSGSHPSTPSFHGVTVKVLNGTTTSGLAHDTRNQLEALGFRVVSIGDSTTPYQITTIYYAPGAKAVAVALKNAKFPTGLVKPASSTVGTATKLTVIVGADFASSK